MVPNSVSYYRSASYSHVGMVRKVNEDASLDAPEAGLWVVADGMGGHAAGDFVSSLIVDTLRRIPAASSLPAYVGALRTGLAQVNERVRQEAGLRGVSVMGSTLVLLAARGNRASCLWAGDSRLYRLRGGVLEAISRDHSYVQELLDNALISEEEARHHPRANVVTRAVGVHEQLELSEAALHVLPGDSFLLCSDGLYEELSADALGRALSLASPQVAVERLFDGALSGAARDNLTAVVIRQ